MSLIARSVSRTRFFACSSRRRSKNAWTDSLNTALKWRFNLYSFVPTARASWSSVGGTIPVHGDPATATDQSRGAHIGANWRHPSDDTSLQTVENMCLLDAIWSLR